MKWYEKVWNWIAAAGAIIIGLLAYREIAKRRDKVTRYEQQAETLEQNAEAIDASATQARQARNVAKLHAALADSKKAKAEQQLREVAEKRGSRTAQQLADRINNL